VLPAWGALATVLLRARALLAQAETAPTPAAEAQPFDWEWL